MVPNFKRGALLNRPMTPQELEDLMSRKTYVIELKAEFDDETRHAALQKILRRAARQIYTSAMLLNDKERAKPQIALHSEDFFAGTEQLTIKEPDEELADGA